MIQKMSRPRFCGVLSVNGRIKTEYDKAKLPFMLAGISLLGFVCGVLIHAALTSDILSLLLNIIQRFNAANPQRSYVELFCTYSVLNTLYLAVTAFGGVCVAGIPFIISTLFINGLGKGLTSACIYGEYSINGLEYCVLIVYPAALLMMLSLISGGTLSLKTNRKLIRRLHDNNGEAVDLKSYAVRYIVPVLLCLVSSATNAGCVKMFSDLFEL